jgi:4-amino-4-deoxy-L-arabinose transferase-like glycosyltransferase
VPGAGHVPVAGVASRPRLRTGACLAAIAAAAIVLRFWRLRWGLDDGVFFPDEIVWFARVSQFVPLTWASFDVDFTHFYPTLFGYLAGLPTAAAKAAGLIRQTHGIFDAIYVVRVVTALVGVAEVAIVGLLGWRCFSAPVGVLAAALMAVLPLDAVQVHYASVDGLLAAWFALALLAAHALAVRGGVVPALLGGLCVGLAFSTKYTGLGALGAFAVPLFVRARTGDGRSSGIALAAAVVAGVGAGAMLGCPPCVLRPTDMLGALRAHFETTATADLLNARLVPSLGWVGTPYVYELVAVFPFAFGWPLWLLSLGGIVVAVRRRSLADWVLLGGVGTYFVAIGASPALFPRYLMPLAPGLLVLAARAGVELARRSAAGGVVVAAAWLYTLVLTASHVSSASLEQQKALVAWLQARPGMAPGTRVAYPERGAQYFFLPPFLARAGFTQVPMADGEWLRTPADVFVVPELLAIGSRRDHPDGAAARDLARLEAGEGGFREAVRWPMEYMNDWLYQWPDPGLSPVLGTCGFTVYVRRP